MYLCNLMMRTNRLAILLTIMLLFAFYGQAQDTISPHVTVAEDTEVRSNFFVSTWNWFSRWREKAQLKGYEPGYVDFPRQYPWVAGLYGTMAITNLSLHLPNLSGDSYCQIDNTTGLSSKLTAGLYYRGWGISIGPKLSNKSDFYFTFSSYGRMIGFDIKIDYFQRLRSNLRWADIDSDNPQRGQRRGLMGPEMILLELNSYIVFNPKRFSYASALSQTTWQKRSAGSAIAGISYYASYTGFDKDFFDQFDTNAYYFADTLHHLSHNILVGIGYAYNKVWDDGKWMLHASVLPLLRWAYYTKIDINPNGLLSNWPESQQTAYLQTVNDLQAGARATYLSAACMLKLAGFYNISQRWLAGVICSIANSWTNQDDGMHSSIFDSKMLVYAGYRF